ncbi:MAG: peptide chain release factor N(5)-glutamine methyltransferase [Bryobacterales bacterium]|nr:peptide chain release factor N(5)-glutamine methyltransferase [Bryobacterales bacterium]
MTVGNALLQGTKLLEEAEVAAPRLTCEVLLRHAVRGAERSWLYAHSGDELTEIAWLHFGRYLHERLKGAPTQYITGRQEFYGREFRVTRDVLIPRPETEHVVETAIEVGVDARRVLDAGTGSGAIALTLRLETGADVWASDISLKALAVARENAGRLGAAVNFVAGDLLAPFRSASFDLIVSNPPYVPLKDREGLQREVRDYEPHVALFAGLDGFEIYARLLTDATRVLRPGGWIVLELGYSSLAGVRAMLGPAWHDMRVNEDLGGIPRVISARLL